MGSRLTIAKSFRPLAPGAGKVASYFDQNGVKHIIDENGIDTVSSGRAWWNWVQNSGFWFAQRQVPATLTTYSSTTGRVGTADRWCITNQNASAQFQRVDTIAAPEAGLQARYYGSFTKITANGKIVITQMLESIDTQNLRGRTMRLQMKLKGTTASAFGTTGGPGAVWRIGLFWLTSAAAQIDSSGVTFISAFGAAGVDPTLGTSVEYVQPKAGQTGDNCVITNNGASCTTNGSWQRFGALFDIPPAARNLFIAVWSDDVVTATSPTGGISISEVSLTDGYEPQVWAPEDYITELERVQRYIVKTFAIDTAPAQNVGLNTGHLDCIAGKAGATANGVQWNWRLPVRQWGSSGASILTFNPAAANGNGRDVAAAADCSGGTSFSGVAEVHIGQLGAAGTAVGNQCSVHVFLDNELI